MFDLAIVGLGAMGAAVAWHASRLGASVLGIDRFDPPHSMGSTHAETRVTRLAVGEGPQYLPFVARSHELWRELEALTGEPLMYATGGCIVTDAAEEAKRWTDFTAQTARIAEGAGIAYSVFDGAELERRYPQLRVPQQVSVGFEPTAGIVMCERAVAAQLDQARQHGAELLTGRQVTALGSHDDHVTVHTETESYDARQVVYWFEVTDLDEWTADRFPFLMWIGHEIEDYLGVFPVPPDTKTAGLKILGEQFQTATTPSLVDRTVTAQEIAEFHARLVAPRLRGVSDRCLRAEICLYTNTVDDHFVIDTDPRSDRITVMSPCSGHGFKHSTALGEAVAQAVVGPGADLDLEPFRLERRQSPLDL